MKGNIYRRNRIKNGNKIRKYWLNDHDSRYYIYYKTIHVI